jgi:transposase
LHLDDTPKTGLVVKSPSPAGGMLAVARGEGDARTNPQPCVQAVGRVPGGERRETPAQVCRKHQVAESLLLRWCKEDDACGEAAFAPAVGCEAGLAPQGAELERVCGQLTLEDAILTKALQRVASRTRMCPCGDSTPCWASAVPGTTPDSRRTARR